MCCSVGFAGGVWHVEIRIDLTKVNWVSDNRAGNCTGVSHLLEECLSQSIRLPFQSTFLSCRPLIRGFTGTVMYAASLIWARCFVSMSPPLLPSLPRAQREPSAGPGYGWAAEHRGLNHMAFFLRVRASSLKLWYLLFYFPFLASEWEDCTFTPSHPLSLVCFVLSSSEPVKQKGHDRFLLGATGGPVPGRPCSRWARLSVVSPKWAMIYARLRCWLALCWWSQEGGLNYDRAGQ